MIPPTWTVIHMNYLPSIVWMVPHTCGWYRIPVDGTTYLWMVPLIPLIPVDGTAYLWMVPIRSHVKVFISIMSVTSSYSYPIMTSIRMNNLVRGFWPNCTMVDITQVISTRYLTQRLSSILPHGAHCGIRGERWRMIVNTFWSWKLHWMWIF